MKLLQCLLLACAASAGLAAAEDGGTDLGGHFGVQWTHGLVLDRHNRFHLLWRPEEEQIFFEIQAETLGYVAVGFSPNGGMRGSDIVLAWVDDRSGQVFAQDRFAYDTSVPLLDSSQDCALLGGFQNGTHTVVAFSRKWDTCDRAQDMKLGSDTVRLIWAHHPTDPSSLASSAATAMLPYHGRTSRGARSVYLRELPQPKVERTADVREWELRADSLLLPEDDHTHYWCRIFRAPKLDRKHHMIGFEPVIEPGHESYVHHMVLYECRVPDGDDPDEWFASHADDPGGGARCYSPNMPPEWTFCLATNTWAWAVGSEGETLPDHVGIPLGGEEGASTYFMLETHYDNPAMHRDVRDNSGIKIFYTDQIRQFDASMLLLGSEVNFLHLVPPRQDSFRTLGRCTSRCTRHGLPSTGIRILNGVLHSHLAGRRIRLRHLRDGRELEPILTDDHYDFNFQASRRPDPEETLVLPGDELIMDCAYDTTRRSSVTLGGLSTREEMCLGFVLYYPRVELADCRSLPALREVTAALGVEEVEGEALEMLDQFMRDIDGRGAEGGESLQRLLEILARETGRNLGAFSSSSSSSPRRPLRPLTEEDILKQPFYTVVQDQSPQQQQQQEEQASLKDYRNLLPDMIFSLKIKSPPALSGVTLGDHVSNLDWEGNRTLGEAVGRALRTGKHNSLCLAHGRRPIIPYGESSLPDFAPWRPRPSPGCGGVEDDDGGAFRRRFSQREDDSASSVVLDHSSSAMNSSAIISSYRNALILLLSLVAII